FETESTAKSISPPKIEEEREPAELPVATGGTRDLAADMALSTFSPITAAEAEPQLATPSVEQPIQPVAAQKPESPSAKPHPPVTKQPELRPTEILGSVSIVEPITESRPKPEPPADRPQSYDAKPEIEPPVVTPPPTTARLESP